MAIIGFILGSVLGLFASLAGLLAFDLPASSAFMLYMATATSCGLVTAMAAGLRPTCTEDPVLA
jgi:predicted lysophospholipase L1 biosynthesis ABC-type transport system permease subunit